MNDLTSHGFEPARPASPDDVAGQALHQDIDNAIEPIGIVQEIAGSSSAIALDLQRLIEWRLQDQRIVSRVRPWRQEACPAVI